MVNKRQISLIRNLITVGTILLFASFLWIKDMGVYFETNDDRIIAEILSGVHSLTQDPHTIHENYLLMLPLSLLYKITSGVSWYGWSLLLCHATAWFVTESSFLSRCKNWKDYLAVLIGLSGLFLGSLELIGRIQFTSTAVILAISGYIALYLEENRKKGYVLFFVTELLAFCVRYKAMLMIQPLGGIVWLGLALVQLGKTGWSRERLLEKGKEAGRLLLIWAAIFLLGGFGNIIGYHSEDWKDFLKFSETRAQLFDYHGAPNYEDVKDILDRYDVTENVYDGFCNYNILDWEVSTDCIEELVEFQKQKAGQKITLGEAFRSSFEGMNSDGMQKINKTCVTMWVILTIWMIFKRQFTMLYPLLGILSVRTALWMYLIYQGRLPARVSYPLFTGEALLLFSVFWYFYTEESEKRKHLVTVAGGIVCLIVLLTGTDAGRAQYRYVKPENEGQKVYMEGMKEVLDYCNGNAEKKFLLDGFSFNYYKGSALETESYGPRNAVSFGTWFSNSPSAIEKWKNYFTEDDAAIYVIVYEDGNMENYPAIRMMSEQMQCPAVLDDRIDVSTGITYLVCRLLI